MSLPTEPDSRVFDLDPDDVVPRLVEFIRGQVSGAGRSGVVIGMSGGIDSSLVAHLAVRALGPKNVHGYILPYRTTSEHSLRDAMLEIEKLRMAHSSIDITPMVDEFERRLPGIDKRRLGNVMARVRMTILYDQSEQHNALVVGTSNRTETLLGYGTLFGDMAWAFGPIGDLYKGQVRRLSRCLGVDPSIVDKAPTADLWPQQTDEGEMGVSYEVADRVLYLMFERNMAAGQIVELGYPEQAVGRIRRLIDKSEFKRRRAPVATIR
jgi:NAD+ synthase